MTPGTENEGSERNAWDDCLALTSVGAKHLSNGDYAAAEKTLLAAIAIADALLEETSDGLPALAIYNLALLRIKQQRHHEVPQLRELAASLVTSETAGIKSVVFQTLMADVLLELGENRKGIPFCQASLEQAVEQAMETGESSLLPNVFSRAAKCYLRNGLRDHAAVLLRELVKMLRAQPADARLPAALLDLGNAVRKTLPQEAEDCFQEAAAWHVAKAQLQSATPAWVNLGVLYAETGRLPEALEMYQQALRVREKAPGTPPARMGTLLNNIANCYRRMGRFDEAFPAVDRAIVLLKPGGGTSLGLAFGTRGLIFRDQGKDADAMEWFRKSLAAHENQPGPNLETVAESLQNQAEALRRLGRLDEANVAEEHRNAVQKTMQEIPGATLDLSNLAATAEDAVLIELNIGLNMGMRQGAQAKQEVVRLGQRLADAVRDRQTSRYSGHVTIPESTTLMFHGADGEALFESIRTKLLEEPVCSGARVTIRHGQQQRELFLPGTGM